jgi:polyhydroxybutyrate depolymerase
VRPLVAVAVAIALLVAACGSSSSGDAQTSSPAAATTSAPGTTTAAASASAGASPASPACAAGAQAPASKVAGAPLDTLLRVPASARGHRAPLILALHFASGTGAQMEQATRYTPEAARSGFAVAYPTASENNFWSLDDLDKLAKTLDAVERVACIDPARVYVSGISNGGFMATVLACRMAGRIAAAALFAPGVNGIGDCAPSRPISVLEVHGTSDPIVPYRDIPAFVAGWAKRDGCSSRSTAQRRSATVTIFRWPGCRGGAQVEHLRLTRGKHIELLPQLRAAGVDPARTAWAFLRAHRLPAS